MRTLYIIRHAKSSWKNPTLRDFDRPLNSRGEKNAPDMGRRLAQKNIFPDLILTSPAKRACHTALLIGNQLRYAQKDIQTDEHLYHADSDEILEIIRKQKNINNSIMIFGHNPGLTDFANRFIEKEIENIPTAGVVALSFHTDDWEEIKDCKSTFLFFDYPKNRSNL